MKMNERPPSIAGLEEPDNLVNQNGQTPSKPSRRLPDNESNDALPFLGSSPTDDVRPPVTKPPSAKLPLTNDPADGPSIRQTFQHIIHSAGTSRTSSTRTSSSSLQALNEDTVVDARSNRSSLSRPNLLRRVSRQPDGQEYPVYPDQSYASLQSQVHPTWQRSRSSYPAPDFHAGILSSRAARTVGNTPVSSPGLFSLKSSRSTPFGSDDEGRIGSPYLHPTQLQPPKETHTVEVDRDSVTGNKTINQYEILDELGRGEHGKVKLGRHVETRQEVAIKIVQRYSKRRRLGKLGNPEDKVKKEVAILKKARHPNVVSLLEVIDDPNRQKVYIVLEYVENGEIIWRRKGVREIVHVDKLRLDREKAGIADSPSFIEESQQYIRTAKYLRRQREKARERAEAQAASAQERPIPAWSLEHGVESDDETETDNTAVRTTSRSMLSPESAHSSPSHSFSSTHESVNAALDGSMYGPYTDDRFERRFSTASSSFGYAPSEPEWSSDDDDMSYVPCLTINEARNAFRDSLLGVEYLHYQGIIHRDIKPANLLLTSNYRVKISDFGVSYLGRPMREEEDDQDTDIQPTELDDARELSKTVGTPAFYAPELCYTGDEFVDSIGSVPKITGAIDVWSLGVTLYGMVFGRLPFVSDDEYSMFQTIVKKDVFIPRKRLKPVEDDPNTVSQWPRSEDIDKRMQDELAYEDIDDELYDLLKRLLTKDPVKRITVKEIKHHPWILYGLPNPRAWVEETDPGYQSKGQRIEVSTEEVTSAVSKVPFIQRVRSNVAKWSNYLTGRSKEGNKDNNRKRSSLTTPSLESLSNAAFGKLWDSNRGSKEGDDFFRREHPLAQSVTASPVEREEQTSYFVSHDIPNDRPSRPYPPERATSTLSTAESAKTVKASDDATPLAQQRVSTSMGESSTDFGGIFGGASRRAKGQNGDRHSDKTVSAETASLDDRRCEPTLALSVASAVGQMQNSGLDSPFPHGTTSRPTRPPHRRHLSFQHQSPEPFHVSREALRQRKSDPDSIDVTKANGDPGSIDSLKNGTTHQTLECSVSGSQTDSTHVLTTSPPSAATISSSSVEDYTSGMSQSASHPSIPSVVSGASSLSGDGFYAPKDKECDEQVPSILRTGETVKAPLSNRPEDDESRYYCDDENEPESGSDSEDEGLMIGKKQGPQKAALRVGQKS